MTGRSMKITYQQQPELINIHRLNLSHIVKSQCTHLLLHLPPHTLKLVPAPLCVWKHPWGQNPTLHTWIDHAAVAAINVKWVFVRESRRRLCCPLIFARSFIWRSYVLPLGGLLFSLSNLNRWTASTRSDRKEAK